MVEKRGDEWRHHRIEIGGAACDADVGELGLGLAREIGKNARAQRRRTLTRMQELDLGYVRIGEDAGPPVLRFIMFGIEPVSSATSRRMLPARSTIPSAMSAGSGVPPGK